MKKYVLLLCVVFCCAASFGQKSKKSAVKSKPKVAVVSNKKVLAKIDNVTAELFKGKETTRFYLLVSNAGKNDTILVKMIVNSADKPESSYPAEVKITPFTAKGIKLHCVTWTEKTKVGEPKTKLEESIETHNEVYELSTKTNAFSNTQKTTNITEVVFLDKVKVVSETQQKTRREGMEMTILPDGDLYLKNKQSESKYTYKAENKKFVAKK
jgi:hypothetical protein